jgi:DNA-binding CsgD family transcriptional regulator
MLTWHFRYHQALLAAVRGDPAHCRALADELPRWAAPRGGHAAQLFARHALVVNAMAQGEFDEAYHQADAISPAGTFASHIPNALWVAMDLVEAAVRTGRRAAATAHVDAMREAGLPQLSSRMALLTAASAAIVAPDDSAPGLFEEALATPGASGWPFDQARVQLAFGERLRRVQATTRSREHLLAALETFQQLGASPWITRASHELRATGQTKPRTASSSLGSLTPQEHQIAALAAAGLTNKQIGERLFLSPRTVGGHLYRAFPKLGITSRAALRDALADRPSP